MRSVAEFFPKQAIFQDRFFQRFFAHHAIHFFPVACFSLVFWLAQKSRTIQNFIRASNDNGERERENNSRLFTLSTEGWFNLRQKDTITSYQTLLTGCFQCSTCLCIHSFSGQFIFSFTCDKKLQLNAIRLNFLSFFRISLGKFWISRAFFPLFWILLAINSFSSSRLPPKFY